MDSQRTRMANSARILAVAIGLSPLVGCSYAALRPFNSIARSPAEPPVPAQGGSREPSAVAPGEPPRSESPRSQDEWIPSRSAASEGARPYGRADAGASSIPLPRFPAGRGAMVVRSTAAPRSAYERAGRSAEPAAPRSPRVALNSSSPQQRQPRAPEALPSRAESQTSSRAGNDAAAPGSGSDDGASEPLAEIQELIDRGQARMDEMTNYQVRLIRQERVNDRLLERESVLLSIRRKPFAVRLEWTDGPNEGRMVLWSRHECEGLMHIHLGKTLVPVPPMRLAPESPMAMANSRHPIYEAGLDQLLENLESQIERARSSGDQVGRFELRKVATDVPSLEGPGREIVRITPRGETWRLVIAEGSGLPVFLSATDAQGRLLEHYEFHDLEVDLEELERSDAFDPRVQFGQAGAAGSWLDRLTRPSGLGGSDG